MDYEDDLDVDYEDVSKYTIRVSNVSNATLSCDLQDLFRPYGHIFNITIEKGQNSSIAYVTFITHEDAMKAVSNVNGCGYENHILKVEHI